MAFINESIILRLEDGSNINVPRFRLDCEFVQSAVDRMAAKIDAESKVKQASTSSHLVSAKEDSKKDTTTKLLFSHLHHLNSNSIILSNADLKRKCSANVTYNVVARAAISIKDGGVLNSYRHYTESHYDGDVLFIIHEVPTTNSDGTYEVTENDVRRWIVSGAIRNTETVDVLTKKKKFLTEKLGQIEQQIASLPTASASISVGKGRVTVGSSAQYVRDKRAKTLSDEKERHSTLLLTTTQSLETLHAQHLKDCTLSIKKRSNGNETCDWAIQVVAEGDKKEMYTGLLEKNPNWSVIPMYAFGSKRSVPLSIPEEDQSHHFVDMGEVTMNKLPHGFGIFESYEEFGTNLHTGKTRGRHRLFHGQFHEGEFSEGTLYNEASVFSGKFSEGHLSEGEMTFVDGVKISGKFAVDDVPVRTSMNPYCRALPNGLQTIKFPDKAIYEGVMNRGRITGRGDYKYKGVHTGPFKDGTRQVDGGDEGQCYSNLHLSVMFDGKRLWGPRPSTKA